MNGIFNADTLINAAMTLCWIGLLISSVMALTIIVDRFIYFTKIKSLDDSLSQKIVSLIKENEIKTAIALCETSKSPLSNIIIAGLNNSKASKEYMQSAEILLI